MTLTPEKAMEELKELLYENRLSVFAGSGISVDSRLPDWDGFIDKYIEICVLLNDSVDDSLKFSAIIEDARHYKDKSLIDTITALKDKVKYCQSKGANIGFFDDELNKLFYSVSCNEYHELLVSTKYAHIITTNYDNLLEEAAKKNGYNELLTRSYSYVDYQELSAAIYSGKTAIIHAHGKISDLKLDRVVLTKQDYLNIMKHNPGFRLLISAIFIQNSVLFVGYGGSDPHFEDIIDDLNSSLKWNQSSAILPKCYIMMKQDKITPIREYLNDNNRIDIIPFNDYDSQKAFLRELRNAYPR